MLQRWPCHQFQRRPVASSRGFVCCFGRASHGDGTCANAIISPGATRDTCGCWGGHVLPPTLKLTLPYAPVDFSPSLELSLSFGVSFWGVSSRWNPFSCAWQPSVTSYGRQQTSVWGKCPRAPVRSCPARQVGFGDIFAMLSRQQNEETVSDKSQQGFSEGG